jgi:hypothetical protein
MELETIVKMLDEHNAKYPTHPNDCVDLNTYAVEIHTYISTQESLKIRRQLLNILLRVLQWEQMQKGSATGPLPKIPME